MQKTKNIIIAPLNWGLGHATRCIPIINVLLKRGFNPIIASDRNALQLLQKEFPDLTTVELPSYGIKYPKNGSYFTFYLLKSLPKIFSAVAKEKQLITDLVEQFDVVGIISDNRFGVYHKKVPSVYITHQLRVFSGILTWMSSKLHQHIIKKFNECWVPDDALQDGFSGALGHLQKTKLKVKYLGVLSRFEKQEVTKIYDYLVLLSGPQPQRGMLAQNLLQQFENTEHKVVFVLGNMEVEQTHTKNGNMSIYNYMLTSDLSTLIQQSKVVISRSGYTTIMDLAKLNTKAFFIPTSGQFEQLYLAKRLQDLQLVPYALQDNFQISDLEKVPQYKGLQINESVNFSAYFKIFE